MTPLFSIVTVALNAGPDLLATALSVVAQRFGGYEYLIKDGGSIDGSLEALAGFKQARTISCPDTGIYDAMNQALALCRGEYVMFLNAGDVFMGEQVLETVAERCQPEDSPALVYTDYATTFERKRIRSPHHLREGFLFRTMLCHQACYVRRDSYERYGGFDTSLKVVADFDFLLRLVLRARAATCHVPIVGVVSKEGGYSSRPENFGVARNEVALLRKRYFSTPKRLIYGALYGLTFPGLRSAIVRKPSLRFLRPLYRRAVNAFNHLAYGQPEEQD